MFTVDEINCTETTEMTAASIAPPCMVLVSAGTFLMGSNEGSEAERPVREVYLEDFWMDETPVTNHQFLEFVRETNYRTDAERCGAAWGFQHGKYSLIKGLSWCAFATENRAEHPVVLVSWYDAAAFANWAGKELPTEAQWEKSARGGLIGQPYPWGEQSPDNTMCGFAGQPSEVPCTTEVKSFAPNGYGLYDMVGNVWQWCSEPYGPYGSPLSVVTSDYSEARTLRVRRGGAWNVIQPFRLRCSNRGALEERSAVPNVGFRCVLNLTTIRSADAHGLTVT